MRLPIVEGAFHSRRRLLAVRHRLLVSILGGIAMLAVGLPPLPVAAASSGWVGAGSMSTPRVNHTATLLPSGKVLVVGGDGPSDRLSSAELYDPRSNKWSTAASMSVKRHFHTATLLGNGKVLVAGGSRGPGQILSSAELYDPATDSWSPAASMKTPRAFAVAVLLDNGKVLMTGGLKSGTPGDVTASAELYDPASNTWTSAGQMNQPRTGHIAVLLLNGKVLVEGDGTPQIYNPDTNSWSDTLPIAHSLYSTAGTLLQDGRVLVGSGISDGQPSDAVEIFDPVTNSWADAAPM